MSIVVPIAKSNRRLAATSAARSPRLRAALTLSLVVASAGASLASAAANPDQAFVTKATQGGLAEVALGRRAASQGTTPEVKQFAKHMVDDHSKAGDELASTARKAGANVPDAPSAAQQAMATKLTALQGAAFDKAYAQAMVKDHRDTIALFKKEAKSGHDADLKAFASQTLPTLEDHLKMATDLQKGMH